MSWGESKWILNNIFDQQYPTTDLIDIYTFYDDGSFIVPNNIEKLRISGIAAGGGGNGSRNAKGCGGGGECLYNRILNVSPGDVISFTIGKGGIGGGAYEGLGTDGGDTEIFINGQLLISLEGGKHGETGTAGGRGGGTGGGVGNSIDGTYEGNDCFGGGSGAPGGAYNVTSNRGGGGAGGGNGGVSSTEVLGGNGGGALFGIPIGGNGAGIGFGYGGGPNASGGDGLVIIHPISIDLNEYKYKFPFINND